MKRKFQHEAIVKVMEENGGFATLGFLYQKALKVDGVNWGTKTPFASMRRIVQDRDEFFKIRPGLWALKSWKHKLPELILAATKKETLQKNKEVDLFDHTYYQGLLVQMGNIQQYETYVPAQDKNKLFLGKDTLGNLASRTEILNFTYPDIVHKAKSIDVVWFNIRKLPLAVFEVEHSTNIQNSLVKYVELQDFRTDMVIVADSVRRKEFDRTISLTAFAPVRNLVRFLSYEKLSEIHSQSFAVRAMRGVIDNKENFQ